LGNFEEYCNKMGVSGTWGDHATLQAASDKFRVRINLITSYKNAPFMEIVPNANTRDKEPEMKNSNCKQLTNYRRNIWLSFFGELHYNSLYTAEDLKQRKREQKKFLDENSNCTTIF